MSAERATVPTEVPAVPASERMPPGAETTWVGQTIADAAGRPLAGVDPVGDGHGVVRLPRRLDAVYWDAAQDRLVLHGDGGDGGYHNPYLAAASGAWLGGGMHQPVLGEPVPQARTLGTIHSAAKAHPSGCAWWQSFGTMPFTIALRFRDGSVVSGGMGSDNATTDARGEPYLFNSVAQYDARTGQVVRMTFDAIKVPSDPRGNSYIHAGAHRSTFRTIERGGRLYQFCGVNNAAEGYRWDGSRRLMEPVALLYPGAPNPADLNPSAPEWPEGRPVRQWDNQGFTWAAARAGQFRVAGGKYGTYETFSNPGGRDADVQVMPNGDAWYLPYDRGARMGDASAAWLFPCRWTDPRETGGVSLPRWHGSGRVALRLPEALRRLPFVGICRVSEDGDGGLFALGGEGPGGPLTALWFPGWAGAMDSGAVPHLWAAERFSERMRRGHDGPYSPGQTGGIVVKGGYAWEGAGQGGSVRVYRLSDGAKVATLATPGISDTSTMDNPAQGLHVEWIAQSAGNGGGGGGGADGRGEWRVFVNSHVGSISVLHRVPGDALPPSWVARSH